MDAKQGLFAVRFTPRRKTQDSAFGFSAGPYQEQWKLTGDFKLHAWVKASAAPEPDHWRTVLYDAAGHKAETDLIGMAADGKWREYSWPIASLQSKDGFDAGAIRAVQIEAALPQGASLWLDDVFFQRDKELIGISDKTVTQYMAEAAATRAERVAETMVNGVSNGNYPSLAPLYQGVDLEETNRKIIEWTEKAGDGSNGNWGLFENAYVNEVYFSYSSKGRIKPGVLSAECERKLLEYYWKRCELKNDIATARQNSWWVTGSENHDINFKMANLLSSEVLRRDARMFIDLVWAQWAQDQAVGFTGGSVTRGSPGWTRLGQMAEFLMGGPGRGSFYALSDYQWPRQVWEMLLSRPTMGEYAFVARKPNEAQDVWPQPPGTEYTLLIRPDSRLVHYSWVTPDYVMGTRMDHPDALYCHLSGSKEAFEQDVLDNPPSA